MPHFYHTFMSNALKSGKKYSNFAYMLFDITYFLDFHLQFLYIEFTQAP